ncbi:hypothetical protein BGZ60DRAFT_522457 [Tricladium varicosporioides]|nr:hypothetical protein BGZ60DRAFT_522457 [Hymenoscyphus varicosporioides]
MGNYVSTETYLRTDSCSARNITWQYVHHYGELPAVYSNCTDAKSILQTHCCYNKTCHPNWAFDNEFKRYEWRDWDGLGQPGGVGVQWGLSCWSGFHGRVAENVTVPVVDKSDVVVVVVVNRSVAEAEVSPPAEANQPLDFSKQTIEYDTTVWKKNVAPRIISIREETPGFEERREVEEEMVPTKTFDGAPVFPKAQIQPVFMMLENELKELANGDTRRFGPFTHPIITPPPRQTPLAPLESDDEKSNIIVENLVPGIPPSSRLTPSHPSVSKGDNIITNGSLQHSIKAIPTPSCQRKSWPAESYIEWIEGPMIRTPKGEDLLQQNPQANRYSCTSIWEDKIRTTVHFPTMTISLERLTKQPRKRFDYDRLAELELEAEVKKHLRKSILEGDLSQVGIMEPRRIHYMSLSEYSLLPGEKKKKFNSGAVTYQRIPRYLARTTPLPDDKSLDGERLYDEVWNHTPSPQNELFKQEKLILELWPLLESGRGWMTAAVVVVMVVIVGVWKFGGHTCRGSRGRIPRDHEANPRVSRKKRNSNDQCQRILEEVGLLNDQPQASNVMLVEDVRFDVPH